MPSYGDGSRRGEPTGATCTGSGSRRCPEIDQCNKCHGEQGCDFFCEDLWKEYAEQWLAILRWDLQRAHGIQEEVPVI
jgi:hypothetical protein